MISITEEAAKFIKRSIDAYGKGGGIRLAVRASGCSGFSYDIGFATQLGPDDSVMYEIKGVKIFVDKESEPYLAGTEIDFAKEGLNEGLKFNNPNAENVCGCGDSFTV